MPSHKILRKPRMHRSASKIQAYWRMRFRFSTTYKIIHRQMSGGMQTEVAKAMAFETLVETLKEKTTISKYKAALRRVHMLTTFRHGSPSSSLCAETVNVRVVLAGFMVAYKSTNVFESVGPLEQALMESATRLIASFEEICNRIMHCRSFSKVPAELTKDFPTLLFKYLKCFKAWKVPDEAKLSCRIKWALVALYRSKEYLSPNEPPDSKLRIDIEEQTQRLRYKLREISGEKALREFDEKHKITEASVALLPSQSGGAVVYATLPGKISNQQMAHELLIDPGFQLTDEGGCVVEQNTYDRIRSTFERAYWDSLVDDLKQKPNPCYVRIFRVCCEIRDSIVMQGRDEESHAIREVLDIDFIQQQTEAGLCGPERCKALIAGVVDILRRFQTAKRKESLEAEWKALEAKMDAAMDGEHEQVFCNGLEFLMDRVHLLRIDQSNARLRIVSPIIQTHGVSYEREHFDNKLQDGTLTLERTTSWIDKSLKETIKQRGADGILQGRAADYVAAHVDAIFFLLTDPTPIQLHTTPETLLFDTHHLQRMQREIRYLTDASTMIVALASTAPRAQQVTKGLVDLLLPDCIILDLEAEETVLNIDNELLGIEDEATRARARLALFRCIQPSDPVRQIMQLRVHKLIHGMMTNKTEPVPPTMQPLLPRFHRTVSKINRIVLVNRTVHAPTYNKLLKEAALKFNRATA